MNQPSIEHTTTCAEDLAGNDPKKTMLLEIMDHCGLGHFLNSAVRKVALHQVGNDEVCALWGRTNEAEKAFFIINAPRPNPFYPIQDSYISFLKGCYSGNIDAMAKSEKTNQEALDANLKSSDPVPVEEIGTLDGQMKTVASDKCTPKCSHEESPSSNKICTLNTLIAEYRPVVTSSDGNCGQTLPTLKEFLIGTGKDIQQLRDVCLQYRKSYRLKTGNIGEALDEVIELLERALDVEEDLYDRCRKYWDPFVSAKSEELDDQYAL